MALTSILNCPICNGTEFNVHLNCVDYTTSQERFTLKKCLNCNFTFTDPRPDDATLPNYYQSDKYISHTGGSKSLIDNIYLLARKITLGWKRKLVKKYSEGNKILDIGCGTGEFLFEMKSHGWNISGVEPSSNARESSRKKTGVEINKSIAEVTENNFNAITLWHVLEHLPDPNLTLKTIYNLLNQSGTIFIAVPNLESYDATHYESFWAAYDVPRHLWHFDKKNMEVLLKKNGLELVKILPMRLDSFYVSLLSESYQNSNRPRLLQLLFAFIIGLKSNFKARKNLDYSSLIYVVKR
ncbi:MAG TPA: class I SAM-dependent methyltransferase [Cyclobacteriaceae bacterium]|jgi:SAM-dependent methyltransferase|nr:class I SAM-dependent methyltransferase [Cyclobacteriaceae bacterium]